MTNILRTIQSALASIGSATLDALGLQNRALGMGSIWSQVYQQIEERDYYAAILDIFHDDAGAMFAVLSSEGKLYRADVSLDGGNVGVGEWVEVVQEFVPTGRSLQIVRQADGRARGFLISSTAVLNRVNEIDSTTLHDNLNRRAHETGRWPYIDFFHFGPQWRMGQVDYLARDEYVAIASFLFDDSELAEAMVAAYEADPEYWGASISYYPIGNPEKLRMGGQDAYVEIPVYTDGEYEAITLLPEAAAAAWFTALRAFDGKETNRMNQAVVDALTKLAGGNATLLAKFLEQVDETNRSITERNLVRRDGSTPQPEADLQAPPAELAEAAAEPVADSETTPEPVANLATETEPETDVPAQTVALDDEAVEAIVAALVAHEGFSSTIAAALAPIQAQLTDQARALETARATETELRAIIDRQNERLAALEADDGEKQRNWTADLSRKTKQQVQVTYRPRQSVENTSKTPRSLADRANETLERLGVA